MTSYSTLFKPGIGSNHINWVIVASSAHTLMIKFEAFGKIIPIASAKHISLLNNPLIFIYNILLKIVFYELFVFAK